MRFKLLRRRWFISTPKMTIKNHLPWPIRMGLAVLIIALTGLVTVWAYHAGQDISIRLGTSPTQLAELKTQIAKVMAERDQLSAATHSSESQLNMERATQKQLAAQIKTLETENIQLKENLTFFEKLLPANTKVNSIIIRHFVAKLPTPNQLHYRLLLMQNGKNERPFKGTVQFTVTFKKGTVLVFPNQQTNEPEKFNLGFKRYQTTEGILAIPTNNIPQSIQVRILENGKVRVQESISL